MYLKGGAGAEYRLHSKGSTVSLNYLPTKRQTKTRTFKLAPQIQSREWLEQLLNMMRSDADAIVLNSNGDQPIGES